MAWLLSEQVQRVYLILSGLIVFFLGAQLLYIQSEPVAHDIRLYHWPARLEGASFPVRALGKDLIKRRLSPLVYCGDSSELGRAKNNAPSIPLDLLMTDSQAIRNLCLQRPGGAKRLVPVEPPPALSRKTMAGSWAIQMGQAKSHSKGLKNFPFGYLILPESGSFNPRDDEAFIHLWISEPPAELFWVDKEKKEHLVTAQSDGFYQIPLRRLLLQGKTRVVAYTAEKLRYPMDITFHGISRDHQLRGRATPAGIRLEARSLQIPGRSKAEPIIAYCSLFAGTAMLRTFTLVSELDQKLITMDLPLPSRPPLPLAIQCDSTPLGSANDSSWTWVLPEPGATGYDEVLKLATAALPKMVGPKLASRVMAWGESSEPLLQRRFLKTFSNLMVPEAPAAVIQWSSAPALQKKRLQSYEKRRAQLLAVVIFLLVSWLAASVIALRNLRRQRAQSLFELAQEGALDELPEILEGGDALERPHARALALAVLGVTILGMIGLVWVLTSF